MSDDRRLLSATEFSELLEIIDDKKHLMDYQDRESVESSIARLRSNRWNLSEYEFDRFLFLTSTLGNSLQNQNLAPDQGARLLLLLDLFADERNHLGTAERATHVVDQARGIVEDLNPQKFPTMSNDELVAMVRQVHSVAAMLTSVGESGDSRALARLVNQLAQAILHILEHHR